MPNTDTTRAVRVRPVRDGVIASLILAATTGIGIVGVLSQSSEHLRQEVRGDLIRLATMVASTVDAEQHATLTDPQQMDGDVYNRTIAPLRAMRQQAKGIKFIYTSVLRGDKVIFILDSAEPGDHDGVEDRAALGEVYEDPDSAMLVAFGGAAAPP